MQLNLEIQLQLLGVSLENLPNLQFRTKEWQLLQIADRDRVADLRSKQVENPPGSGYLDLGLQLYRVSVVDLVVVCAPHQVFAANVSCDGKVFM